MTINASKKHLAAAVVSTALLTLAAQALVGPLNRQNAPVGAAGGSETAAPATTAPACVETPATGGEGAGSTTTNTTNNTTTNTGHTHTSTTTSRGGLLNNTQVLNNSDVLSHIKVGDVNVLNDVVDVNGNTVDVDEVLNPVTTVTSSVTGLLNL